MKQLHCTDTITPVRLPAAPGLGRLWLAWLAIGLQTVADRVLAGLERSRQRRRLAEMDDRMLRDIGITRAEAGSETQKWFWQP